jgi:hypothetical protein
MATEGFETLCLKGSFLDKNVAKQVFAFRRDEITMCHKFKRINYEN